jgi:hypothetical protein
MNFMERLRKVSEFSELLFSYKELGYPNYEAARSALAKGRAPRSVWRERFSSARKKSPVDEKILKTHVTVQASNGKIYTGPMHPMAALQLAEERPDDFLWLTANHHRSEKASGFATNLRPHVPAAEASRLANRRNKWAPGSEEWRKKARPGLHSQDLQGLQEP